MNVDAYYENKEKKLRSVSDHHLMQTIVIQDSIVDSFCTGSVFVYLFPFIGFIWDRTIEFVVMFLI